MSAGRLHFEAEVVDLGRVAYRVQRVGTFTMSYGASRYPRQDDGTYLEVGYGRWSSPHLPGRNEVVEDAPVIYGVHLVCGAVFDADVAIAHLLEDSSWPWWLATQRRTTDRAGWEAFGSAPEATARRAAGIVAALTEDYLDRDDAPQLLAAHRRGHAQERLSEHQRQVYRCQEEMSAWTQVLAREDALVTWQQAWADGLEPSAPALPDPVSPAGRQALTHLGAQLLARAKQP